VIGQEIKIPKYRKVGGVNLIIDTDLNDDEPNHIDEIEKNFKQKQGNGANDLD
jgi:hypothetical protein